MTVFLHLFGGTGKWKYDATVEVLAESFDWHLVLAQRPEPLPGLTVSALTWLAQGGYIVGSEWRADGPGVPRLLRPTGGA